MTLPLKAGARPPTAADAAPSGDREVAAAPRRLPAVDTVLKSEAARAAIREVAGREPELFTGGGTSDARFISPWGAETVEIGPINDSIHKINEHVRVADLEPLAQVYQKILERLL